MVIMSPTNGSRFRPGLVDILDHLMFVASSDCIVLFTMVHVEDREG